MPHWLINAAFFAQENAKPQNGDAGTLPPWLPLLAIGILFYFLMIRPQSREKAKRQELLNALKKNDKIVTIGGILGTIASVSPDSDEVTIKVDENTRLRILRSSIQRVVTTESESDKSSSS